MKGLLNQASDAAVKTKGSIFEFLYRRLVPRLGHAQAIGAIAHRLCRLIWMILHQAIRYEERGAAVSRTKTQRRAAKMIRELRVLAIALNYKRTKPAFRCDGGNFRPWTSRVRSPSPALLFEQLRNIHTKVCRVNSQKPIPRFSLSRAGFPMTFAYRRSE
jgi:hypothetical protein